MSISVVVTPIQISTERTEFTITPVVAQGIPGATGPKGNKGDDGSVAGTLPASSIIDLDDFIETETDPGNLTLWFENQLA